MEEEAYYPAEDRIWADVDGITGMETDLLLLNRALARVGYTAITEGISLGITDKALFWMDTLIAGRLFEEYDTPGNRNQAKDVTWFSRPISGIDITILPTM